MIHKMWIAATAPIISKMIPRMIKVPSSLRVMLRAVY